MATPIKKKAITRNRETLTCIQCRSRKLRCDKQLPCGSCVKRGEPDSCSYVRAPERKEGAESRASKAEARLQHLEQLVQGFAQSQTGPSSASHDTVVGMNGGLNGSSNYTGATHYSAMLEDIDELRQVLSEELDSEGSPATNEAITAEADVLFGGTPRLPLPAILSRYLPSRLEVDRRIAAYFRAEAIAAPFIHIPQFMRQYEQFWSNPQIAPPLWTSILFSICALSCGVGKGPGHPQSQMYDDTKFALAAAHCLAVGRYSRPQRFAVEALVTYIQAKLIETLDPSRDLGILYGTLTQLAYSMGYHREPDLFKQLSAFEGEMRRRAWSVVLQLDFLTSFQLGIPNNIQSGSWDTKCPSNLKDSDFDEQVEILPPSRPECDPTRISFYTTKHMLITIFDKILRQALAAGGLCPEHELIALDEELHTTYRSLPALFHYKSIMRSLVDPIYVIVARKCVELMFQKCICVLHRKHVTAGRLESVEKCRVAATAIVQAFHDMYPEFKPGGQFFEQRWLLGSITWNDYLLGIMVLCLVLCHYKRPDVPVLSVEGQIQMLQMLKHAYEICDENIEASFGARRTKTLLSSLLSQTEYQTKESWVPEASTGSETIANSTVSTQTYLQLPDDLAIMDTASQESDLANMFQGWNDHSNVFDTQEWAFLEESLNANFDLH